jgi:hypothetical protein
MGIVQLSAGKLQAMQGNEKCGMPQTLLHASEKIKYLQTLVFTLDKFSRNVDRVLKKTCTNYHAGAY